ncbi:MAG: hypothetical protein IT427_12010 [Pirellulales bacterium]|nr:hypothetical protein [Pirellulales bacterium]
MAFRNLGLIVLLLIGHTAGTVAKSASPPTTSARWHRCCTKNFLTYSTDALLAQQLARNCESKRDELAKRWLGEAESNSSWSNCRCCVVVHPTAAAYAAAVGHSGESSSGCSTVRVSGGRLVCRRIDLRADCTDPLTAALPHELTHIVLADKFLDRSLPRWADEGMAILADPPQTQSGHRRDAQSAMLSASSFSVDDLLQMTEYPPPTRQTAFYGQSAALARFLVDRGGHKKLVDFVDLSMAEGSDRALSAIYHISNTAELDQLWRRATVESFVAQN